jgi:hypothetical protein
MRTVRIGTTQPDVAPFERRTPLDGAARFARAGFVIATLTEAALRSNSFGSGSLLDGQSLDRERRHEVGVEALNPPR